VRIAETTRALADETARGVVTVVVAQTTESRVALARELTLRAAAMILTMSFIALAGVVVAVRLALRPVDRIGAALRDRDPLDLAPVNLAAPRELGPFLAATNAFIARLQARMDLMERFVADAAHQIRTPLAALRAQIDIAARRPDDADRLDRARARAEELSRLVGQLLSDATVSHRAGTVPLTPVDLGDLLRRAMREAIPETLERDLLTTFEGPPESVTVEADPISLKEAAKNLIDNALRHGAPGRLTIRLRRIAAGAEIEVEDDGPGIPAERRALALSRFAAPSPGGSGLGLSIAARAAAAHGGGLDFRGPDENGFAVILRVARGSVA
jgi:two-component system sensor histidine kinase TctE